MIKLIRSLVEFFLPLKFTPTKNKVQAQHLRPGMRIIYKEMFPVRTVRPRQKGESRSVDRTEIEVRRETFVGVVKMILVNDESTHYTVAVQTTNHGEQVVSAKRRTSFWIVPQV